MNAISADQWHGQASTAFLNGDTSTARLMLVRGLAEHPQDGALWQAAANLLMQMGDAEAAATHFGKAAELIPADLELVVDQASALSAADRNSDALMVLQPIEKKAKRLASYWSTRANAARGTGNLSDAAKWYDRALAIEPSRPKALHGRACVALERAEPTALNRFDRALKVNPGDPHPWLGKAQALDVAGDVDGARKIATSLVEQAPGWIEGLRFLAQLRLAAGEADFASHYADAARKLKRDPNVYSAWCSMLASQGHDEQALQAAAEARLAFPELEHFAFLEAVHASSSGLLDRAEAVFKTLEKDDDDRWLQEARHHIRAGKPDLADGLLDRIFHVEPWNINAWALRDQVWRVMDDPRSEWLHAQDGLVRMVPLHNADRILPKIVQFLHDLHDGSPFPLGQSLRGGTQTRGTLFGRIEPELASLKDAILTTVEDYRRGLPPLDPTHPLLRHRDNKLTLAGSWSVRLSGSGDFHTAHIHQEGVVSSALYLDLPGFDQSSGMEAIDPKAGWLELGRPAADLRLDLKPLSTLKPEVGHLALFPSTLYHGTRPFSSGRRMTVAFDVISHAQAMQ